MRRLWQTNPGATLPPMTDNAFLLTHTPGPTLPVAPAVSALRISLANAALDLMAIPDAALERGWQWRDDEADVRYGLYRCIEALEEGAVEVRRVLRDTGARRTPAAERIAAATEARWDLHGLLATLDDAVLDRHPADGEWTGRETLAHIVSGQRAYGWYTAWWTHRPLDQPAPDAIPRDVVDRSPLPEEDSEGIGSIDEIRSRLDAILDLSAGRLAHLDDDGMAAPARWAGIPVTVGFRLGRWSSHLIEHTLQLDKTLTMLRREPTEVARLVRLIHAAYGRLEAHVFPIAEATTDMADERGISVSGLLQRLAANLEADAASARAAAANP